MMDTSMRLTGAIHRLPKAFLRHKLVSMFNIRQGFAGTSAGRLAYLLLQCCELCHELCSSLHVAEHACILAAWFLAQLEHLLQPYAVQ